MKKLRYIIKFLIPYGLMCRWLKWRYGLETDHCLLIRALRSLMRFWRRLPMGMRVKLWDSAIADLFELYQEESVWLTSESGGYVE